MKLKGSRLLLIFLILSFPLYSYEEEGIASWYGGKFQGRKTANGEIFDTNELTAAHKTLPFDTLVRVENKDKGLDVIVRINDRGPYVDNRIIDLSFKAAQQIDMISSGTAVVKLTTLDPDITEIDLSGPITFTIQVAAYGDLLNALNMKKKLTEAGFNPSAELTNSGNTKIVLKNIHEQECYSLVKKLETMNISGLLIKQDRD